MTFVRGTAKFQDCAEHGPGAGAELFVVEGDSASLSVIRARDARTQAVLPMQGKPLNAVRATEARVRAFPLFVELARALGTDMGKTFNGGRLRYERVLLLMDPDADGIHCGALMLMFFYKWMRPLLAQGIVQMVRAPVGEVRLPDNSAIYGHDEEEYRQLCLQQRAKQGQKLVSVRYRGLGSMEAGLLTRTCLDPATRKSHVVGVADAEMALRIFAPDVSLPLVSSS